MSEWEGREYETSQEQDRFFVDEQHGSGGAGIEGMGNSRLSYRERENFEKMKESASSVGVSFIWEIDGSGVIHVHHIVTDHGWEISLDRSFHLRQSTAAIATV